MSSRARAAEEWGLSGGQLTAAAARLESVITPSRSAGVKRCGQIAAGGPRNIQRFTAQWMTECENAPLRLRNRQHQAARQSPDRPPDLARRRTPSIVMPLSMAFTMS